MRSNLEDIGIRNTGTVHWNLAAPRLYEEAILRREAKLAAGGALVVLTGEHTGRSAQDKFIVREPENEGNIWWGAVNKDIDIAHYTTLRHQDSKWHGNRASIAEWYVDQVGSACVGKESRL